MANTIIMPKLSPTMEEGQISRWLKKEGETVEANEAIAEVDTDKATMEVTSLDAGTLLKILVGDGANAKLGETIGIIGEKGEDFSALLKDSGAALNGSQKTVVGSRKEESSETSNEQKHAAEPADAQEGTPTEPLADKAATVSAANGAAQKNGAETEGRSYDAQRPGAQQDGLEDQNPKSEIRNPKSENGRIIVSPIAARMAAENNVDLKSLKGSGPSGRIIKRDIESALAESKIRIPDSKKEPQVSPSFAPSPTQGASAYREENTSKMRQVIASRLTESIGPIPTFYLTVEIEMDAALEFRKQINASNKDEDKVSVNDIVVKVAAQALTKHSWVNSSYQDKVVRFYEDADIGVAVAVEDGLITPVVRGANRKGIVEISREIKEKAARARDKKLQPEEYTGATFSISNLGMFGIKEFTAIINPPEAAIIAVGAATLMPVVRNGEIVVKNMMNVTMSCDHRAIDGATGAKFLQTFKQMLENPILMLM